VDRWLHQYWSVPTLQDRWNQRLTDLGETRDSLGFGEPMLRAATYPETVELTSLLLRLADIRLPRPLATHASPALRLGQAEIDEVAKEVAIWIRKQQDRYQDFS
jgi:hypothetical protein